MSSETIQETPKRSGANACSAATFLALLVIFACGCSVEDHRTIWTVKLVRPDGNIQKEFKVKSLHEPCGRPMWGGQTELYLTCSTGNHKATNIIAPVGWMWESVPFRKQAQGVSNDRH